ncbi:hypothetical protein DXG01_008036 [Tephrocybe rancida]|nr:hypothetical protein DXG01_008036 [Tephrocybe rancida]
MGNNHNPPSKAPGKPQSQRAKDIGKLVEYIQSDECRNVVLMSNLARLKLPHPEAVFEINFFRSNPVPFYTLAAELYPGSFRPTPTHSFIKLLASHDLLHTCFTQNIDTLERRAGVPADKIVEAHGSFATQRCIDCETPFDDDEMREIVLEQREPGGEVRIPKCKEENCGGLVKPDIVFFGEALPGQFIKKIPAVGDADLLLIIGTSLTVQPFASLAGMADRKSCRRVLINLERVGDLGRRPGDVVLLGECDEIVRELCTALGWQEELETAWAGTALKGADKPQPEYQASQVGEDAQKEEEDHQVDEIADILGKRLDISEHPSQSSSEEAATHSAPTTVEQVAEDTAGEKL